MSDTILRPAGSLRPSGPAVHSIPSKGDLPNMSNVYNNTHSDVVAEAGNVQLREDPVEIFLETWCIKTVRNRKQWTTDETLDFLMQPENIKRIDDRSSKVSALYSRMPKEFYLQTIMQKVSKITAGTKATEVKTLLDAFMTWHKEAPPPSNREFSQSLLEQLLTPPEDHND